MQTVPHPMAMLDHRMPRGRSASTVQGRAEQLAALHFRRADPGHLLRSAQVHLMDGELNEGKSRNSLKIYTFLFKWVV